ncbi:MAG: hypothetical protein EB015_22710, partial [Methylocystaceae bacterium]|nr:hypothetical protein [Methylocystaceae bacterium]
LEVAMNIASIGLPILPCTIDKRATLSDWPNKASIDPARLNEWFAGGDTAPAINLRETDLVVVDIDNHDGGANGVKSFAALAKMNGGIPKTCPVVRTPNNGFHVYYSQPLNGERIRNSASKIAPGVDVRGDGGYILAPNASLGEGKNYTGVRGYPELVDAVKAGTIPQLPEWLIAPLCKPKNVELYITGNLPPDRYARTAFERECGIVTTAPEGQRNHTLNKSAFCLGQFIPSGALTRLEAENGLLRAALGAGLPKDEALATIASGLNDGIGHPRVLSEYREFSTDKTLRQALSISCESWPKVKPLPSGLLPVAAFDLRFLPENLAPWVVDVADRMQCPMDFVGVPAIVALGATLGRKIA